VRDAAKDLKGQDSVTVKVCDEVDSRRDFAPFLPYIYAAGAGVVGWNTTQRSLICLMFRFL